MTWGAGGGDKKPMLIPITLFTLLLLAVVVPARAVTIDDFERDDDTMVAEEHLLLSSCSAGDFVMYQGFVAPFCSPDSSEILYKCIELACAAGHLDFIHEMFEDGRVFEALGRSKVLDHALIKAARLGSEPIVAFLLTIDDIQPDTLLNCPLVTAAQFGHHRVVRMLLNHPSIDPSQNNQLAFRMACYHGRYRVSKELLKKRSVDPSVDDSVCLLYAIRAKKYKLTKLLLHQKKINPAVQNQICLVQACTGKISLSILGELLKAPGVDPTIKNHLPLRMAADKEAKKALKMLLDHPSINLENLVADFKKYGRQDSLRLLRRLARQMSSPRNKE